MHPKTFLASEAGALAIEWLVLVAVLAGLSFAVTGVVSDRVEELSRDLSDLLSGIGIRTSF